MKKPQAPDMKAAINEGWFRTVCVYKGTLESTETRRLLNFREVGLSVFKVTREGGLSILDYEKKSR